MSAEQPTSNKAMVHRLHEVFNSGDAELISKTVDEVFEPDVLIGTPLPVGVTGAQAVKEVFVMLRRAFPDLHIAIEDVIAEGDKVVSRNTVTGTHQGEYMGLSPTGRTITYREILVLRFAGGRVAETWGIVDVAAQMRQLGVLPDGFPGPAQR